MGQGRGVLAIYHETVGHDPSDGMRGQLQSRVDVRAACQSSAAPTAFRPSPMFLASSLRFRA